MKIQNMHHSDSISARPSGRRSSSIFALLLLIGCSIAANASVLYQEDFPNERGRNVAPSQYGWKGYGSKTVDDISDETTRISVAPMPGSPADSKGYLVFVVAEETCIALTSLSAVDATGGKITWRMGNSHDSAAAYLLVRTGGQWFMANAGYFNSKFDADKFSEADPLSVTYSRPLNTTAKIWRRLSITPGEGYSLGEVATLPSLKLDGVGFLVENAGPRVVVRIDSVAIEDGRR